MFSFAVRMAIIEHFHVLLCCSPLFVLYLAFFDRGEKPVCESRDIWENQ